MIMMDAEADKSTSPLVPYEPAIVKRIGSSIVLVLVFRPLFPATVKARLRQGAR
jgi:hypothetical protein